MNIKQNLLLLLSMFTTLSALTFDRTTDSTALVAIWESLDQPAWTNWGSAEPINAWDGVLVRNNRVVKITQKNQTKLIGTLAPEIGNLSELDSLEFHNLAIGTLPSTMNSLTKLRYLNISGLSDSLFAVDTLRFPALEFFRIYTSYEDSLPIDFSASPNLQKLTLQKCQLLKDIPQSIAECTKLSLLEIGEIPFDTVPAWIGELSSLTTLLIYRTNLSTLPSTFGNLTNLEWLQLANNKLTSLGFSVENMPNLLEIYLENNQLESVPLEFTTRPVLEYLEMQNNRITSIPEALWTLPNLSAGDTYFSGNRLHFDDLEKAKVFFDAQSHPWSDHFKYQTNVTDQVIIGAETDSVFMISQPIRGSEASTAFKWEHNGVMLSSSWDMNDSLQINGLTDADTGWYVLHANSSIDASLQIYSDTVFVHKVDNLERYNDSLALLAIWDSLGQPNWSNWNSAEPLEKWANLTIDATSGRVTKLVAGSYWAQSAPLAPEIGLLTELTRLQVQNLKLTHIPKEINNCKKLEYLGLYGPEDTLRFEDTIKIDSLKHLALTNLKSSEFPFSFENSPFLSKIEMSYCSTLTAIPEEIRGVTTLTSLRFNNCPIANIATWIGEFTELTNLSVNYANLSSTPAELANCTKIECLELYDNNLSSVDFDVQELTTLYEIYLDHNSFTAVPEIFKDHPTLEYLYFEDNGITEVPMWVFHIPNIDEIEFDGNQIAALPDSIKYLDRWPSLYFNNNFITALPEGWGANGKLPGIMYFNNNRITHLPESFDSLKHVPHRFEFDGNRLHFDELERMKALYEAYNSMPQYWKYDFTDQKNITEKDTLWVIEGTTTALTAVVRGTQDSISYRWYKNGTLDKVGYSADAKSRPLSNITDADTGWYCFEAKSSAASNLTMKSDTFYVQINRAPVITSDTVVIAIEDQHFSYKGTADNDNGDAKITYENLPNWLSVDADSVKGTPLDGDGDTSFTVIASDGILNDSLVVTVISTDVPDTTVEISTEHLIGYDTTVAADTSFLVSKDTVIQTIFTEITSDTTVTTTDTLIDLVIFKSRKDSSVVVTSEVIDTVFDTLIYIPVKGVIIDTTHSTVRDTSFAVDSVIQSGDTIVATISTENWIDSMFVRTDSLADEISYWFHIDTSVTSGSITIDTITDTLFAAVAIDVIESSVVSSEFLAYPNPVTLSNGEVLFSLPESLEGTGTCTVYDVIGHIIDQQSVDIYSGASLHWDLTNRSGQRVSSGSYVAVLKVIDQSGAVSVFKTMVGVKQ